MVLLYGQKYLEKMEKTIFMFSSSEQSGVKICLRYSFFNLNLFFKVSQYTFVLCSYLEKKSEPKELMTLDNFTVDYTDFDMELKALGGKFFFNAVKEGDNVSFATDEETERQLWVQALYRATGQSHKPTPPSVIKSPQLAREQGDVDRARKHGMEEFIQADPSTFNHNDMFKLLQSLTLDYRLNDLFCSLVSVLN